MNKAQAFQLLNLTNVKKPVIVSARREKHLQIATLLRPALIQAETRSGLRGGSDSHEF